MFTFFCMESKSSVDIVIEKKPNQSCGSDEDFGISYLIATKNREKNQNQDVIAQDGNRVVLLGQPEQDDYINATRLNKEGNYLDRTWIVTQGPMDNTIEDFWRMVWQEDIRLLVMLTKTFEVVRLMCSQYWPLHMNSPENYGIFQVELIREERYAHFKVSCHRAFHFSQFCFKSIKSL